jgi:hypothetical protein
MTTLMQTVQLAIRIALVWAGGMLLAVAISAVLPDRAGITLYGKQTTLFVPFSRMGFWTCIVAALIVTVLVVGRAFLADIGWSSLH